MEPVIIVLIILVVLVFIALIKTIQVIPQASAAIVERFGRYTDRYREDPEHAELPRGPDAPPARFERMLRRFATLARERGFRLVFVRFAGEPADLELRVQEIAAFLQVAAVGHLCQHVGRAEQEAELAVQRVLHVDAVERDLVAGEMHHLFGQRRVVAEADGRQVVGQEIAAAAHVVQRELGAVALLVRGLADVAGVVEQRADDPQAGAACTQATGGRGADVIRTAAVPAFEPGHYSAPLTLASAGEWTVDILSGFSGSLNSSRLTLRAIDGGRPAPVLSEVERGRQLFVAKGCITCHYNSKAGSRSEYVTIEMGATDLSNFSASPEVLFVRLKDPAAAKSDTKMPNLGLKKTEIEALIVFINSQ